MIEATTGIDVPRETWERLEVFVALLSRWNRRIRLIGAARCDEIWIRHIADSLQLLPLMASPGSAIDLGSGAGFPGLVLAIAGNFPFTLIEADHRKAAFLAEAARATATPVRIVAERIENVAQVHKAALVTARALAPLNRLLEYAAPLLLPGGCCLFPKGEHCERELTDAAAEWQMKVERFASRTAPRSTIFRISEIAHAGAARRALPR